MNKVFAGLGIGTAVAAIVGLCLHYIYKEDVSAQKLEDYDRDGYDQNGYDHKGFDREGYNIKGFDRNGFDRQGYDQEGFNEEGYGKDGFDRSGFNARGYDKDGYDSRGLDEHGYDREGFDYFGRNQDGFTRDGFGPDGYNKYGYDRAGYGRDKYNYYGVDRAGHNRKYYTELIRDLRTRLIEAMTQLKYGQIRYAVYDARVVMEDTIKAIVYHNEGEKDKDLSLYDGIEICRTEGLLEDNELINILHKVRIICNPDCHTIKAEKTLRFSQVYFIIMQVLDLIGIVEEKLVV